MSAGCQPVRVWEETVVIPTYPAPPPDLNPMFLEKRVYQGSTGKVYPNPFTDRVSDEKTDRNYRGVFLENEYIRLMILPEIGGRIHIGLDKTNDYDFFYRQNVIKPALVGLLGPWISGGVEFNWPQHHRPSTFMPVDHLLEKHADGSCTVWLSEHEPMNRMKGMVGICLHPGRSIIEAKIRLYNRTPFAQTFLWWANVAARVHEQYQAFFPPDVTYVADHAKRAISSFPLARNFYYGVDYREGVDLRWYKNIPVPTSYMVTNSRYDFFGGYDHSRHAGFVHVADHHLAPGKKMWTWGNAEFGYAWDRELTDSDGPYIELMAGVGTDNQPDFSWLRPYETKTFSQFWYPIQEIGLVKNANTRMAVSLERSGDEVTVGVCATKLFRNARVLLTAGEKAVFEDTADIEPGKPFRREQTVPAACAETDLLVRVLFEGGEEIIRYRPEAPADDCLAEPASEPPAPGRMESVEELFLTGLHLDQYRHATRRPELYWEEALRRDPADVRCNNAMGLMRLRSGEFAAAEAHFRRAAQTLTRRNQNPYDGEPFYNLGLALKFQDRIDDAYGAFYKSVWNAAWEAPGYYELATIDCRRSNFAGALEQLDRSLESDPRNLKARNLKAAILRACGRAEEARTVARETVAMDPLDFWSRNELVRLAAADKAGALDAEFFLLMRGHPQTCLDIALDYADAGFLDDAIQLLTRFTAAAGAGRAVHPMIYYALGYFLQKLGKTSEGQEAYRRAAAAPPDYCFPARLHEMLMLEAAKEANPKDARAPYYLGNLLYDKRRYEGAIRNWELACALDPSFSIPWRNLGIASYNVLRDAARARACYEKAFQANPADARILFELDQLDKRMNAEPRVRLLRLEAHPNLVQQRDDLTVELVTLYNQLGRSETALSLLLSRRFHPWEGGEGLVSGQYVQAHLLLGRACLDSNRPDHALEHFESARIYPENLGEGKHLLSPEVHLDYFAGVALRRLNRSDEARELWRRNATAETGMTAMAFYRALALRELGREAECMELLAQMNESACKQMRQEVTVEYFATSLPNFLLFEDDLAKRNEVNCLFLIGLAQLGIGRSEAAKESLEKVLALDINHLGAETELSRMAAEVASRD